MNKVAKSNWISITLIILFASLLTLTMYFTFIQKSGAWFTDTDSSSNSANLTFGNVSVESGQANLKLGTYQTNTYVQQSEINNFVPTQTVEYFGTGTNQNINYTGNVDAYYRITFSITNLKNADNTALAPGDTMTTSSIASKFSFADGSSVIYGKVEVATASYIEKGYLEFSSTANNTYTNYKFTLEVKIDLVQAANVSLINNVDTSDGMSPAEYATLFAAYDSWSA